MNVLQVSMPEHRQQNVMLGGTNVMWDRNIVSENDVRAAKLAARRPAGNPEDAELAGDSIDLASDRWNQRLLKYIPGEALSFYLVVDGIIRSGLAAPERLNALVVWLWVALAGALVFNAMYLWKIWKVERTSQIAISSVALVAYVFATGGVFQVAGLREPWQGTLAIAVTTALLAFVSPPDERKPTLPESN
jgi:hypothetical protein